MVLYLDSSSLLKLYVDEEGSSQTRTSFDLADKTATSLVSYAEVRAALASARRGRRIISTTSYDAKKRDLEDDWSTLFHVDVTDECVDLAGELAERHALSGFDGIHLAAAISLRDESVDELQISTWDKRLATEALREGFVLAHEVTS